MLITTARSTSQEANGNNDVTEEAATGHGDVESVDVSAVREEKGEVEENPQPEDLSTSPRSNESSKSVDDAPTDVDAITRAGSEDSVTLTPKTESKRKKKRGDRPHTPRRNRSKDKQNE